MVKRLVYLVIVCLGLLCGMGGTPSPEEPSPAEAHFPECRTFSIHNPIYPAANEDVTYTLVEVVANNGVQSVTLYETIFSINPDGSLGTEAPGITNTWHNPILPVSFEKKDGNISNKFIQYKFEVIDDDGNTYPNPNIVGYAVRPYPPSLPPSEAGSNQPAPVYVQGDIDQMMDVVFIRSDDIQDMETFRDHCRLMILDGIFGDEMTRHYSRFFNFFINPLSGIASPFPNEHQKPDNWHNLTFAEGHALLHLTEFTDHTHQTYFSTEQERLGTILHEAGHALFGLDDEYFGGGDSYASILPNNWLSEKQANDAAPKRHKEEGDAVKVENRTWKICDDECQMNQTGPTVTEYDLPCQDRVCFTINQNAGLGNSTAMSVCSPENDLVEIVVTPANPTITSDDNIQFTAIGKYEESSMLDVTKSVTWLSSDTSVVNFSTDGLVQSVSEGDTIITAEQDGITSSEVIVTVQQN